MLRREFLACSVVLAAPALGCSDDEDVSDLPFDEALFPQSVASGDPRSDRVVLWTRVFGEGEPKTRSVLLEVATDPDFEQRLSLGKSERLELVAERRWDYCVRVRVDGLEADTQYFYRFLTTRDGRLFRSRTGRTRTAPPASAETQVRFLVMSCQDYGGRYYLALRRAAELDAHFVVHLGDYVYETAGDPDFQTEGGARSMRFGDRDGALELSAGEAGTSFLAARSLDNYRDLYRTVRSDRDLQRLHERFAMIVTWDDHEFSDDSWGQNATYQAGRSEELDPARRANADQAWFEYMPVEYDAGSDFEFDSDAPFPGNLRIHRDFTFGKHLHVVMTDLRRFRADHVIPEDANPARIAVTEERLIELLGEVPAVAEPYVDMATEPGEALAAVLSTAFDDGFVPDPELIQQDELEGLLALSSLQALIESHNAWTSGQLLSAPDATDAMLKRGVSYALVGKLSRFTSFGSRYFVSPEAFNLVALDRYQATEGKSEEVMGQEQERWFIDTLTRSPCTWKVWGNSYTLSTREIDLSSLVLPDPRLARRFSLSADDWSGFPNRRAKLLQDLADVDGVVAVTGDSHSFFASGIGVTRSGGSGSNVVEFVCGAVSSTTYRTALERGVGGAPSVAALAPIAGTLIQQHNAEVAFQNVEDNGFALVTASATQLQVAFYQIPHAQLANPLPDVDETTLSELFKVDTLRVSRNSSALERKTEDGYETWDPGTQRWT